MQFSADKVHVVSGSDDGTVRVWDVAVGEEVNRLVGHTDYVRAVAASPQGPEIFASGGYDHMCRIWDVRTQQYVRCPPSESLCNGHFAPPHTTRGRLPRIRPRGTREKQTFMGRTGLVVREERQSGALLEYDDLD